MIYEQEALIRIMSEQLAINEITFAVEIPWISASYRVVIWS